LVKTNCLWKTAAQIIFRHPLRLVGFLLDVWRGRAWMKKQISLAASLPVESLPYNADVIGLLTREKSPGRKIVLVNTSDQFMADGAATHLKLFEEAIGSDSVANLRGNAKAELLVKKLGQGGFG
jgi:hypothetical protein